MLKAHSGEQVRVDRKGGAAPVIMQAPALTLCQSPQPEVLTGLVSKPGLRGRGLLARFAYILPQSMRGRRKANRAPISDTVRRTYRDALQSLLDLHWAQDENGEPTPYILHLDRDSYAAWANFYDQVEAELADGGKLETMQDWGGKLKGLAARLVGNLQLETVA